ncbi:MAG: hypothetical protein ACXVPK_11670, partial [Tumebacillaceae bacterium]
MSLTNKQTQPVEVILHNRNKNRLWRLLFPTTNGIMKSTTNHDLNSHVAKGYHLYDDTFCNM